MCVNRIRALVWGTLFWVCGCAGASPAKPTLERYIQPPLGPELGYAHAVRFDNQLFVSGVLGWQEGAGFPPDVGRQMVLAYGHLKEILDRYGATFADVIYEKDYTTDLEGFKKAIEPRKRIYGENNYPATTAVQIARLWEPEAMIEIELLVALNPTPTVTRR